MPAGSVHLSFWLLSSLVPDKSIELLGGDSLEA